MKLTEAQTIYENRSEPDPPEVLEGEDLFLWLQEARTVKRLREEKTDD